MGDIRVVWGVARGPTALSSYDAALATANVHDYNLVHISSVIPEEATVERTGTAPDLGSIGGKLTVVEAQATINLESTREIDGTEREACAGLGWAQAADGRGVFYEATSTDPETVRGMIDDGLRAGCALREWSPVHLDRVIISTDQDSDEHALLNDPCHLVRTDGTPGSSKRSGDTDDRYATAVVLAVYSGSESIF